MKQSWQNEVNLAFSYNISVNRHIAKAMLDHIKEIELELQTLKDIYNEVPVSIQPDPCPTHGSAFCTCKAIAPRGHEQSKPIDTERLKAMSKRLTDVLGPAFEENPDRCPRCGVSIKGMEHSCH